MKDKKFCWANDIKNQIASLRKIQNRIFKALIQIKIHFLTKKIQPHRMINIDWICDDHK